MQPVNKVRLIAETATAAAHWDHFRLTLPRERRKACSFRSLLCSCKAGIPRVPPKRTSRQDRRPDAVNILRERFPERKSMFGKSQFTHRLRNAGRYLPL